MRWNTVVCVCRYGETNTDISTPYIIQFGTAAAETFVQLISWRTVLGTASGAQNTAAQLYATDISTPLNR